MALPVPICDPHFHVWDHPNIPNDNLGSITIELPTYSAKRYIEEAGSLDLRSAVHVETVVGQTEGGFKIDTVAETKEVMRQAPDFGTGRKLAVSAFVHLGQDDAASVIAAHKAAAGSAFVGVRMIMNYHATDAGFTWPQVSRGDYLTHGCKTFDANFPLLAANGLVFDMHVNWFQLKEAAAFVAGHPSTKVVIDHLGCVKLGVSVAEDTARIDAWREGMAALAALPNVHIKLSGLDYIRSGWIGDSAINGQIKGLVREVIALFGVSRCMFASNFPVDLWSSKVGLVDTYAAFHALVEDLPLADRTALFHDTASRVYNIESV